METHHNYHNDSNNQNGNMTSTSLDRNVLKTTESTTSTCFVIKKGKKKKLPSGHELRKLFMFEFVCKVYTLAAVCGSGFTFCADFYKTFTLILCLSFTLFSGAHNSCCLSCFLSIHLHILWVRQTTSECKWSIFIIR